jgi:hypothetical protein
MTFDDDDMTATITSNSEYVANDLVIPENVVHEGKLYKLTSIGEIAFFDRAELTGSLTIPNSVESIADNAFTGCANISTINLSGFDSEPT